MPPFFHISNVIDSQSFVPSTPQGQVCCDRVCRELASVGGASQPSLMHMRTCLRIVLPAADHIHPVCCCFLHSVTQERESALSHNCTAHSAVCGCCGCGVAPRCAKMPAPKVIQPYPLTLFLTKVDGCSVMWCGVWFIGERSKNLLSVQEKNKLAPPPSHFCSRCACRSICLWLLRSQRTPWFIASILKCLALYT